MSEPDRTSVPGQSRFRIIIEQRETALCMKKSYSKRWAALAICVIAVALPAMADSFQLLSTLDPTQTPPAGAGGDSWGPVMSPDGRYVLFASPANNLVVATNGLPIPLRVAPSLNVYLRDRAGGTITLVSVNLSGVSGGNADSLPVDISTNGRYAVFESSASDLVAGDTNNASDVFVRDLVAGTTTLVSVNTNGLVGNAASRTPAMTPDGHYVAFVSAATDLVAGDTNRIADIFVRDLQAGTTLLASVGALATNTSYLDSSDNPAISADGRYVSFFSTATNLASGAPAGGELYIRDLVGGTTTWASSYSRTAITASTVFSFNQVLSADGKYLAYEAAAPNSTTGAILRFNLDSGLTDAIYSNAAVPLAAYNEISSLDMTADGRFVAFVANGLPSGTTCIRLWDGSSATVALVSGDPANAIPTNSISGWPVVSGNGRYVAFLSTATNLVTNALAGDYHHYLRDMQAAQTTLLDADTNGIGSPVSASSLPRLSEDGRFVAFEAADSSLVANDRNHDEDVFVREIATGATELMSAHDPALVSATANGPSTLTPWSVSRDGRYVAFSSEADNLVANDTNGCRDVFVRDLLTGTTTLLSGATNGLTGDGTATEAAISPDGRYVAFTSSSDNLVPRDNNKVQDVFLRDVVAGTTSLVSITTNLSGSGNRASFSPIAGAGGRYVLFRSKAWNIAGGTPAGKENLFLRDMQAGTTFAISTNGALSFIATTPDLGLVAYGEGSALYVWNAQAASRVYMAPGTPYGAAFTPDGRYLAAAINSYLYLVTLAPPSSTLVDTTSAGYFKNLNISADGRWLACLRRATSTGPSQVYLYDLQNLGSSVLVDHQFDSAAAATGGAPDFLEISPDGRFVVFRSGATNIVSGDANNQPDLFLYDRASGANTLLTASQLGALSPNNRSLSPLFSADGCLLLFESWASDLVSGDFNHGSDIFAKSFLYAFLFPSGAGQGPWLSWPLVPGHGYGVQYQDALGNGNWQYLNGTATNSGNRFWLQDPSPASGQRYYRIIQF